MKATLIPALLIASLAGLLQAPSGAEIVVVQWEKVYNGPSNGLDSPSAVAVDSAGNVIVTGSDAYRPGIYTAKYAAANGALLWEQRSASGHPRALAVDSADNVIVFGSSENDYYTVKYAATNGALLWEKRYNGLGNGYDHGDGKFLAFAGLEVAARRSGFAPPPFALQVNQKTGVEQLHEPAAASQAEPLVVRAASIPPSFSQ